MEYYYRWLPAYLLCPFLFLVRTAIQFISTHTHTKLSMMNILDEEATFTDDQQHNNYCGTQRHNNTYIYLHIPTNKIFLITYEYTYDSLNEK